MGRIEVALLLDPRRVFLARDHWVGEFGLAGLPLQFPPLSLLLFFSNFLGESLHLFAIDSVEVIVAVVAMSFFMLERERKGRLPILSRKSWSYVEV